jgi:5'-nucleotidase
MLSLNKIGLLLAIPTALMSPGHCYADAKDYRILLTNDDGIHAPGLQALVNALSSQYEIIVSAPAKKWSGMSHGTQLWEGPMEVDAVKFDNNVPGYSVHGLPADAARFGIIHQRELRRPIDLLISGVNPGENRGSLAHLSGTVGAAMEGPYYGIPAIAVSIEESEAHNSGYKTATDAVRILIQHIQANGLSKGTVLNVNVPENAKGMKIAPMGIDNVRVDFFTNSGNKYSPKFSFPKATNPTSDMGVYERGHIAITPLNVDWTDQNTINTLKTWSLD